MGDDVVSADAVADFEARLKVKLPSNYIGIPKSVFACLATRHLSAKSQYEMDMLSQMEHVLLELSKDEAHAVAHGSEIPLSRRIEIAKQISSPIDSVNTAIDRFRFFCNERITVSKDDD